MNAFNGGEGFELSQPVPFCESQEKKWCTVLVFSYCSTSSVRNRD